jgi:BolA protein
MDMKPPPKTQRRLPRAETIRLKLVQALAPLRLRIVDESSRHAGHPGAGDGIETHFHVEIVTSAFAGLSRIDRQRRVYEILTDEFEAGLHALRLTTLTPGEEEVHNH